MRRFSLNSQFFPPLLIVALTLVMMAVFAANERDLVIVAMIYLVVNFGIAVRYNQRLAMISALMSAAAFDFFFIPPQFKFAIVDPRSWVNLAVTFAVTILTSRLMIQLRRSAQKTLAAEMEAEREKLISSLLSSISHDLRTPLTSISGAVSTLLEKESKIPAQDRQELLESIHQESMHLNSLVAKILQISKIEAGKLIVKKEIHSLEEVIGSTLNRLRPLLKSRAVTTDISSELSVPLDAVLIEQVLVNLIENIAQHTPELSPIDISGFQNEGYAWVELKDRGPGISKSDQEHIFEKFFRGQKKDVLGSGLGLAICHGIINVHQGRIGMKNREGGGSIFYFSLPLSDEKI